MDRRKFIGVLGAAAFAVRWSSAQTEEPSALTLGETAAEPVPPDFTGLSYESAQLANPAFFSPRNTELISLFRELSVQGNLRIGGGSGEFTTYSETFPGPVPFEVFGPDTSKTVKQGTTTTRLALQDLRGFLDATGWNCLYGLNLGQGSVENAVAEAAAAHSILGPRLKALQIGNEPDSFRNRYRAASYGPADYMVEWARFHDAIAAKVPSARFAGPDISNKLAYLTAFADAAPRYPDVILLTSHYYAMGPAGSANATIENLLDPEPKSTTLKDRDLHVIAEAQLASHLPYRMSEGNSCWNGGQPEVSDTFAAALWCIAYMLTCMGRGWAGVNMHGGGNGVYSPIADAPSSGFIRRPEFFGMLAARQFAGARVVKVAVQRANPLVEVFAFEKQNERELVIVNKTSDPHLCTMPEGTVAVPVRRLSAPAIDAKNGVVFQPVAGASTAMVHSAPYTATVYRLQPA